MHALITCGRKDWFHAVQYESASRRQAARSCWPSSAGKDGKAKASESPAGAPSLIGSRPPAALARPTSGGHWSYGTQLAPQMPGSGTAANVDSTAGTRWAAAFASIAPMHWR